MARNLHAELAGVERCIARAEANATRQRALIAVLARHGHAAEIPEKVLRTLDESLTVMRGHRELILAAIAAQPGHGTMNGSTPTIR